MGPFSRNPGRAAQLDRRADKQRAKAARTGNGSYLERAAQLRAKADKAARKSGR